MKKLLSYAALATLMLVLASCNGGKSKDSGDLVVSVEPQRAIL